MFQRQTHSRPMFSSILPWRPNAEYVPADGLSSSEANSLAVCNRNLCITAGRRQPVLQLAARLLCPDAVLLQSVPGLCRQRIGICSTSIGRIGRQGGRYAIWKPDLGRTEARRTRLGVPMARARSRRNAQTSAHRRWPRFAVRKTRGCGVQSRRCSTTLIMPANGK